MRTSCTWTLRFGLALGAALPGALFAAQDAVTPEAAAPAPPDAVAMEAAAVTAEAEARAERERLALQGFVDGLMTGLLARGRHPGAVVAIVQRDGLRLARGYGIDRLEPLRAADPERSLFRIGSISKTFTYVAAMQLVEAGLLQLDDPVELHLPAAAHPPTDGFEQPIRVRHLLTHTAGFEDTVLGHLFGDDPATELSLLDYVQQHRPRRVRPPGQVAVYSNYSVALLGLLVAQVRNQPFESVIEEQITGPLGMTRSSFREPLVEGDPRRLDPGLAADLAQGFERRAGAWSDGGFEFLAHGAPAGGMSASAADMGRWMRLLLREGELDGVRILRADSLRRMREERFANAPEAWPVGLGFLIERFGPFEAFGHGGATLYFHSQMLLVPELDLGVFVSINSASARSDAREAVRRIVEHIAPQAAPAAIEPIALDLAPYVGHYRSNRRPYAGPEKLLLALDSTPVRDSGDGALLLSVGGEALRFLPTAPGLFRQADGHLPLQFLPGADGRSAGYVLGHGIAVSERVAWYARAELLALAMLLAGWVALARLLGGWRSRRRRPGPPPRPGLAGVKALSMLSALAWLALLATGGTALIEASGLGTQLVFDYPTALFRLALALATTCAVLSALELLALLPAWRGNWRAWPLFRHSLGVLILSAAAVLLWHWNLVGTSP